MTEQASNLPDFDALRKQAVKAIVPQLPTLCDEALAELLAREQNDSNPRESLVHAVQAAIEARGNPTHDGAEQHPADTGHNDAGPSAGPAWLAPDYAGPLTADQAQVRIARLGHYTKPAQAVETK